MAFTIMGIKPVITVTIGVIDPDNHDDHHPDLRADHHGDWE
jgi:hypothetical protein